MNESTRTIQSVQRALDIINCVAEAGGGILLPDISKELGLNINTARGLTHTLLLNGYLSRSEQTGAYSLGYEFLTKSKLVHRIHIRRIRETARPHMEQLAKRYSAAIWLQISFYRDIYTVDVVQAPGRHYAYTPRSGSNLPLHASASGKLRLSFMPDVERKRVLKHLTLEPLTEHTIVNHEKLAEEIEQVFRQGYSTELEETDIGVSSVAAPFFDSNGTLTGTLSAVAPSAIINRIMCTVASDLKDVCFQVGMALSAD